MVRYFVADKPHKKVDIRYLGVIIYM